MRAREFIAEVFQPGKTNWEWARRSDDEASAFFKVGNREYLWQAFTGSDPKKWEIQFRLLRDHENDPADLDLFGKTGTGNSAQVLSTAVDIIRAFLKEYGIDKVEEITFNAKEDSRIELYAKMIKRLLPNWELYSKKDPVDGMVFHLTDRRAYDKIGEDQQPQQLFTAAEVWKYVKRIHPSDQQGGGFLKSLVVAHPHWELRTVPLTQLHIPDPASEDEPEDPYDRVLDIDRSHVNAIPTHDIKNKPIVVDADGYIIDGNHRALAASMRGMTAIPAYVPAAEKSLDETVPDINYGIGADPGKLVAVGKNGQVPHATLHVNTSPARAKKLGLPH